MILKLSLKHQAIEFYKVGIHHNAGMALTYLWQGQLRSPMHLNGENKLNVIKWLETRDEHAKVLKIYVHENI